MELLKNDYVNTWIVAKDLPVLAESSPFANVRERAALAHKAYIYPVDSQVYSPEGRLIEQVGTNEIMGVNMTQRYLELLDAEKR